MDSEGIDEVIAEMDLEELLSTLRQSGWMVAVHNDYRQDGRLMTFWLFTQHGIAVKGEGATDEDALRIVLRSISALRAKVRSGEG